MSDVQLRPDADGEAAFCCPECDQKCVPRAIRSGVRWIFACPDHGLIDNWSEAAPRVRGCEGATGSMNPEERLWLLERAFDEYGRSPLDQDYMVIEQLGRPDHYVQFMHHGDDSVLLAEVSSREWGGSPSDGSLAPESVQVLAELGFTGGGPLKNYRRDGIADRTPIELAAMAERLFVVAYGPSADFEVSIQFKCDEALHRLFLRLMFEQARG
ncbi:MAG: hypothetical protein JF888_08860 [Candidatus Dormibacteraeota bacterium]|uniref:TY-Chap N-terminal domain-containing protein n=1 Tax=Candidatus Dormiibacter inghamiae TaxID=3127013 RepID=A0A934K7R9_9BACT|nr:hypothetical protein [Candidatus Dormibacteraeota bacterium]MBJ7606483.1 hypothetical protein [Candidatus Dormibacteraeota bacterium]